MRDINDPGTGAPPNLFRLVGDKDIWDNNNTSMSFSKFYYAIHMTYKEG